MCCKDGSVIANRIYNSLFLKKSWEWMHIQLKERLLSSIKLSTRIRCHIKMSVSVFLLLNFRVKNHTIVIPFSIFPLWCKYFVCLLICFDNGGFSFWTQARSGWSSHIYRDKRKKLLPFVKFPYFQRHFYNGLLSSVEFLITIDISGY